MGKCEIQGEGRRLVALLLSLGLLHIAFYYLAAAWVNGSGALAIPQPDTLLYCQAARRICEGHAFSFSAGTAVSTGTTSVLYPFFLAPLYALGFVGTSLFTAGFWLNAIFYLLFLLGWGFAFRRILPQSLAFFASVLLALFHQPAYCALAQSDTGLWMAVSGLLAAAIAAERTLLVALLLVVGPWVRPEGVLVVGAFGFVALLRRNRRDFLLAAVGAASVFGVMLFNRHLTGLGNFSSVSNKGFFVAFPLAKAALLTSAQLFIMLREILLGLAKSLPRGFYILPVLGPIMLILGMVFFEWRKRGALVLVFVLATAGDFLLVAQSGYQGTNNDRYLAWSMPLVILFGAIGWWWCRSLLLARGQSGLAKLCIGLPIGFSVATLLCVVISYHLACSDVERQVRYFSEIDRMLPERVSVGCGGWSGAAYLLGNRRMANTGGVYSPELAAKSLAGVVEIMKNEPSVRFDYWLLSPEDKFPSQIVDEMGPTEIPGPEAFELRHTDWKVFDEGRVAVAPSNATLRCRVDIGYEREMRAANYEIISCYGMPPYEPVIEVADLNGKKALDTGVVVIGSDEMDVSGLTPGRDVLVQLRTIDRVKVSGDDSFGSVYKTEYSFKGPLGLHLSVDGREVACCHAHIEKEGFTDVVLSLPGTFVTQSSHRIGIHGDHAAFCYWFYQ